MLCLTILLNIDSRLRCFSPSCTFDDLLFSSVSCAHILATTIDDTMTTQTIIGLDAATDYSCCVEAQYTDSSENNQACADGTTLDGSECLYSLQIYSLVLCLLHIHCIHIPHSVPGVPTNLGFVELDATNCGTVTFTWDQPSEDERNGTSYFLSHDA